ncbi:UDP-N-acetylglucosamine 2-epimerase [Paenibacillus jiagnxiensis]|uniref:UDP-N-acetylglucosamine 2-epimerase n=1 Tax=Paenibacillus jiagnxiensis TaxID=3228926 RepID=UPI0033A84008
MVITGTRADYGIYQPVMEAIRADEQLELLILATGMHLSPQYGYTIQQIEQDGFTVDYRVDSLFQGATHGNMARSIAMGILGMTQAFEQAKPDVVLLLGDRGEMLAAAIAASHLNILVAHLHGGEVSGTIDESVRHAISKLAHLHLAATKGSAVRLRRMGEDEWRIHTVGAPRIETIRRATLPSLPEVLERYNLGESESYYLFIYHPVTTETVTIQFLEKMLCLLLQQRKKVIAIRPNADAGTEQISSVYERLGKFPKLVTVTSFAPLDYLTLLRHTEALIGNSSSGIIEAASFNTPVINIGSRQSGRERSANVVDIEESVEALAKALQTIHSTVYMRQLQSLQNVYEHPETSAAIVKILRDMSITQRWIQKTMTY